MEKVLLLVTCCSALLRPPRAPRVIRVRRAAVADDVTAAALYPRSYSLPMRPYTRPVVRAQWLADWRAITDCLIRFPTSGEPGQARLAAAVNAACVDELAFLTDRRRPPSPFAFALIDALFVAAHTDVVRRRFLL